MTTKLVLSVEDSEGRFDNEYTKEVTQTTQMETWSELADMFLLALKGVGYFVDAEMLAEHYSESQ